MAMIKIVKNDMKLLIPAGAYKKQYAPHGWDIEGEEVAVDFEKVNESVGETITETLDSEEPKAADEWDKADEEVEQEKSIDEMTFKELQAKAKELKIDTRNFKQIGEFRKAIKNAIE